MWRRAYLLLILVRLWFALSSSYLHPDENFQGPEVIAGQIFKYPVRLTWEFTSDHPIRSVFPLWPVYGLPMLLLRWLWIGNGQDGEIPPIAVFWTLRVLMFILSFVLEDWAIHELVPSRRHRQVAVLLVASSYVTWTFQTHTFSNSVETLVVLWSLVLIERILETAQSSSPLASAILGMVAVFGVFNRITFPAFLLIPGFRLIPHFINKPLSLVIMTTSALFALLIAVSLDTSFYTPHSISWLDLYRHPVITPWNNLQYNISPSNLAQHGVHPWYQHLLVNLPMLIGPAVVLLTQPHLSLRFYSAISGVLVLSIFQHQEARFLLPTIPLLLSSIRMPTKNSLLKAWIGAWIVFNLALGLLMGVYHQGGIVPAQVFLSKQPDATQAVWWKTYMPPIWLLNGKNEVLHTEDVAGMAGSTLLEELERIATCDTPADRRNHEYLKEKNGTYLIAPLSTTWLDPYLENKGLDGLRFREVWRYRKHLNLDDLDWAEDGVWNTLKRVIGRRGLVAWRVTKSCGRP
ncbi:GPI mannosyltransferase 4 [Xylaria bambusicola]|uniref:GPI mannosyltransferase 4 n=1 Tax=Xylaria bambusicola TaxID=326684 RepID=UPI0020088A4D|nr:GPI mannosyltransferase 4 [Xylaria bambusicola]KAI0506790.1 GPI mannosyltransferase 4 [Xylaria bambusicola]